MKKMKKIPVQISWSGDNYCAGTSHINGVVIATSKTLDGVKKEFADALKFHIAGSIADKDDIEEYLKTGAYEIDYILHTSALLHQLSGVLTHAALSKATGINRQQLNHYAMGLRNPRPCQRQRIIKGIKTIGQELMMVE
jgi:hypothetical protein